MLPHLVSRLTCLRQKKKKKNGHHAEYRHRLYPSDEQELTTHMAKNGRRPGKWATSQSFTPLSRRVDVVKRNVGPPGRRAGPTYLTSYPVATRRGAGTLDRSNTLIRREHGKQRRGFYQWECTAVVDGVTVRQPRSTTLVFEQPNDKLAGGPQSLLLWAVFEGSRSRRRKPLRLHLQSPDPGGRSPRLKPQISGSGVKTNIRQSPSSSTPRYPLISSASQRFDLLHQLTMLLAIVLAPPAIEEI